MRAQTVDVKSSTGRVLCCTVFRPGGKKLLAKGHVISDEDVRVLESEGMESIWVTELEDGEVGEDDAVCAVASEMGCGSFEIRLAAGGRANLLATENCCVLVDDELLKQINCTASVVIATALNFSYAVAGQRIATVKSAPFAVAKDQLEAVIGILKERGPILQARPVRTPSVGVLYTDPISGERARQLFENIMRQRLERFGVNANFVLSCTEDENSVARCLQHLLRSKPCVILVASTTAPAGPEDVIGQAMLKVGWHGGAVPGARGAGQPAAAGVQGRCADDFRAGLFPLGQAQRGGPGAAAAAGALSRHGLGNRLPGTRRIAAHNWISSTLAIRHLRADGKAPQPGVLKGRPVFLCAEHVRQLGATGEGDRSGPTTANKSTRGGRAISRLPGADPDCSKP